MYIVGEYQLLYVIRELQIGYLLGKEDGDDLVLLPFNECVGEITIDSPVMVFVYRDTEDKLIATMKTPYAVVGDLKKLEVVDNVDFGSFIDIGLQRDVLVPIKEMEEPLKVHKKYLFYLYLDRSERICATTRVYNRLSTDHELKAGDKVMATVVRVNKDVGTYVAIEDQYQGMIPRTECYKELHLGDELELRVIRVREDRKVDLSCREKIADQIGIDAELIFREIEKGKLNLTDKSDPELIKEKFAMSKKAFKRAVGRLLKEGKIELLEDGIIKK